MSQSLSKLYVHIMFHVKNRSCMILDSDDNELYAYLGGLIKLSGSIPIMINGTENHVHILCSMSKNISLADLMEDIKKNSSRWIKTKGTCYKDFAWQGGYSAYSVSQSKIKTVTKYIQNQKSHHNEQSFEEEYVRFLDAYEVNYDERYLWT